MSNVPAPNAAHLIGPEDEDQIAQLEPGRDCPPVRNVVATMRRADALVVFERVLWSSERLVTCHQGVVDTELGGGRQDRVFRADLFNHFQRFAVLS
jgi:hypothetical protein